MNGWFHQVLVLIGIRHSITFDVYCTSEEWFIGFLEGLTMGEQDE